MKRKNIAIVLALIILVTSMVGCNKNNINNTEAIDKPRDKYSYQFFGTFDTLISVIIYESDKDKAEEGIKYIEDRFNELHKIYSRYIDYPGVTNIKTINDKGGTEPVQVPEELFDLIDKSIQWSKDYSDVVDISTGTVVDIWQDYQDLNNLNEDEDSLISEERLPTSEELKDGKAKSGMEHIHLDHEDKSIYIDTPGIKLDVGATAKGYAVELVSQEMIQQGFDSFLISGGGDVKVVGKPEDGVRLNWGVGIQNPNAFNDSEEIEENAIETLYVSDNCVVTSGDYQRFFVVDNKKYHHIIDMDTLYPSTYYKSISVVHPDGGFADYLATALFILPLEEGQELIESIEDGECLWILQDDEMVYSSGMEEYAKSMGATSGEIN